MVLKTEPLPTSLQSMSSGVRVHGAWLDTMSISAKRDRAAGLRELEALQSQEDVLVGHRSEAEPRPDIPEVALVVDLAEAAERPLRPLTVIGRLSWLTVRPSGALECVAHELVARDELVAAPLPVHPDSCMQRGVRYQLALPNVGDVRKALRAWPAGAQALRPRGEGPQRCRARPRNSSTDTLP